MGSAPDGMGRPGGSLAWLASSPFARIAFAPEGIADVVTEPAKTEPAKTEPAKTEPAKTEPAAKTEPEKPVRPDWLPETFWDAEKGFKKDDLDALVSLKAETDSRNASVPESADKYEVKLPVAFKLPEGFELPNGEVLINPDDPRVAAAREWAHSQGKTQAEFEEMLALGANMDIAERGRLKEAVTAEREKLGGRAVDRIKAVTTWLDAKLGAEDAASLHSMMFTAKQIEAFERLMQLNRGDVPGKPGAARGGAANDTQIEGYENMTFRQRMAAIDARKSGN